MKALLQTFTENYGLTIQFMFDFVKMKNTLIMTDKSDSGF